MKKFMCIFAAAVVSLSVCACGGKKEETSKVGEDITEEKSEEEKVAVNEEKSEEKKDAEKDKKEESKGKKDVVEKNGKWLMIL